MSQRPGRTWPQHSGRRDRRRIRPIVALSPLEPLEPLEPRQRGLVNPR
jgi:hypothetical protein